MPALAVVACSDCKTAFSVELRHKTATCPRCPTMVDLRRRRRLWEGDAPEDARQAVVGLNAALRQGLGEQEAGAALAALTLPEQTPKHDSVLDAAAAKARAVTNMSQRAETVALWLHRLQGPTSDEQFMDALQKAGLPAERAEREIIRMLACDIIYEPRVGAYAIL